MKNINIEFLNQEKSEDFNEKKLIVALRLAQANLKKHAYEDCEKINKQIIKEICGKIGAIERDCKFFLDPSNTLSSVLIHDRSTSILQGRDNELTKLIEIDARDSMIIGEIMAYALIGIASSYAERDSMLKEALDQLEKAYCIISRLNNGRYRERIVETKAAFFECKGLILYKLDIFSDYDCPIDEDAIQCLEKCVSLKASSSAYLHLAQACKLRLERLIEADSKSDVSPEKNKNLESSSGLNRKYKLKQSLLKERAKACCRHAKELDIKNEFTKEIEALEKGLGLKNEEPQDHDPSLTTLKMDAKGTVSWKDSSKNSD